MSSAANFWMSSGVSLELWRSCRSSYLPFADGSELGGSIRRVRCAPSLRPAHGTTCRSSVCRAVWSYLHLPTLREA
eukprot:1138500-Pleurochrysis_carterae.AAC.1